VGIRFVLRDFLYFPFSEVEFINRLNESLVLLQGKDLIPEPDRKVMETSKGPNPQADQTQNPMIVSGHAYLEYTEVGGYKNI